MIIAGIDIGGTKCASIIARVEKDKIEFLSRVEFNTKGLPKTIINLLIDNIENQLEELKIPLNQLSKIGISCGGPLDSEKGIIMSPPNLLGWNDIPIYKIINDRLPQEVKMLNDADASAIAEWKYGSLRGYNNVIFLTFGTGLGAGLILNGQLYQGASKMAGEVGHIRLAKTGPSGFGKYGSFEGFCSGYGIEQQIKTFSSYHKQNGYDNKWLIKNNLTAKDLASLASHGDSLAIKLFEEVGYNFGLGLSILIDILNPDAIAAGGVFMRCHRFMTEGMYRALNEEALVQSLNQVKIFPSKLGEKIGDYAAICAALI